MEFFIFRFFVNFVTLWLNPEKSLRTLRSLRRKNSNFQVVGE